jgi:hypothetical protein
MSKADIMFEELGYKKADGLNDNFVIWYIFKQYSNINRICFNIIDKKIHFELDYDISIKELEAIVEKCKELGWYE